MDYTATDALAAGFDSVVLIVREEVKEELLDHIKEYWSPELEVTPVLQGPIAGTAQAVVSAAAAIDGPFGVANADDLYGSAALELLGREVSQLDEHTHAAVGYRLADTIITDEVVTRGVCETTDDGYLVRIVEQSVVRQGEGFSGKPLGAPKDEPGHRLTGSEVVSMNLWGFHPSVFEALGRAIESFDPVTAPHQPGKPPELLLPSVVGDLVTSGKGRVHVAEASGRCIGITHPDDLELVRSMIAEDRRLESR